MSTSRLLELDRSDAEALRAIEAATDTLRRNKAEREVTQKNKSPRILTKNKSPHKIRDTERRFYFDSQKRKAAGREATRKPNYNSIERRGTSERRIGTVKRQATGKSPVVLDCSKDRRNVGKIGGQEIEKAVRAPWKVPNGQKRHQLALANTSNRSDW